jgi:hypothetical protein
MKQTILAIDVDSAQVCTVITLIDHYTSQILGVGFQNCKLFEIIVSRI